MTRGEFENTILPVSRNLYRFAFRFLSSREEAEDAVQEVFVKLWKMRDRLHEYRNTEALAMTMTRNHCLDRLRKREREQSTRMPVAETRTSDASPEQLYEKRETYKTIIEVINSLPEQFRTVLQMRDIDGYDYEEIAEQLSLNVSTLRVNLSRGRKLVREQLIKLNYGQPGN